MKVTFKLLCTWNITNKSIVVFFILSGSFIHLLLSTYESLEVKGYALLIAGSSSVL